MIKSNLVEETLQILHDDAKNDYIKIAKGMAKSILRPIKPTDFENAYLPISKAQGEHLHNLIVQNDFQNVVEFGTSFGISTIYLADAVSQTGGKVITTELLESKAKIANKNIAQAGLQDFVEIRIGDAMKTLKNENAKIDFLFLDGWKDLYLPLFRMLETNFHKGTLIYADNMNMADTLQYYNYVQGNSNTYTSKLIGGGKAMLTSLAA